jgi:hypothetical protein
VVPRLGAVAMSVVGLTMVAVSANGLTGAAANAANPLPTTQAQGTLNADGSVTVVMSGTWEWPANGAQDCAGRYGEGFAVDWWGIASGALPANNFTLTHASEVTAPGTIGSGSITAGGSLPTPSGSYFHMAPLYSSETVNGPTTCTDVTVSGKATSTGPWSATATYPNVASIPPEICVNVYDEHGKEGTASTNAKDYTPYGKSGDNDNSIQTNTFDPAAGAGYCAYPHIVSSGSIAGHIYLCNAGSQTTTEIAGGTLSATGPTTVSTVSNPLAPTTVPTGTYTMSATAPSGYNFVTCGDATTIGSPPTTANQPVVVPLNGTGVGIFYVSPPVVAPSALAGHIYLCNNGTQTTTEVAGGSLSATGPSSVASTPNPLAPTQVPAGTFSMTASAPAHYEFVSCGASGTTISTNKSSAIQSVVVPQSAVGTGIFYVDPIAGPNPITVNLVKTNNADGSGTYGKSETAPSAGASVPFRLVVTNTSSVTITIESLTDAWPGQVPFSPSCASAVVGTTLAAGASVTCDFTLPGYAPTTGSVTNTALVTACQTTSANNCGQDTDTSTVTTPATQGGGSISLVVTKTNAANGSGTYAKTETASGPGASVPFRVVVTNTSNVPVTIESLTDSWSGTAPFSPNCANALVGTTLAVGGSETCDFTLSGYAPAAGASKVNTITVVGCSTTSTCTTGTDTSTVNSPPPTAAAGGTLAFTGPPAHLQLLLELGFSMVSIGAFVLWFTRPRRARASS